MVKPQTRCASRGDLGRETVADINGRSILNGQRNLTGTRESARFSIPTTNVEATSIEPEQSCEDGIRKVGRLIEAAAFVDEAKAHSLDTSERCLDLFKTVAKDKRRLRAIYQVYAAA